MSGLKKLKTGIYVYSYTTIDGVTHIKALNENQSYKLNVWWSKVKDSLSSINVTTNKNG